MHGPGDKITFNEQYIPGRSNKFTFGIDILHINSMKIHNRYVALWKFVLMGIDPYQIV